MGTRTNIILDDELIAQAMAKARVTTKKAAVEAALRAFVRRPDYSGLLALEGSGVIADDYDPKALFTGGYPAPGQWVAEHRPGKAWNSAAQAGTPAKTNAKTPAKTGPKTARTTRSVTAARARKA